MVVSQKSASARGISLATETGFELGVQVSQYRYQEHVVSTAEFMHETGIKFGFTADATKAFSSGYFITVDFRFAYSSNDYHSAPTGTRGGIPDYLGDIRLLGGKDFTTDNFAISPYTGIGYRNLFNDLRKAGAGGYRRDSQYVYLPVGVTPRFRVGGDARISTNLEYDYLLYGQEESYLSDISPAYHDTSNDQHDGYGIRGSLMYEKKSWSAGPFFNYWNIDRSAVTSEGYEPHNQTLEYGMQARYRF
jgi:hypothetical protein